MGQKIQRLNVKFVLGVITLVVGLVAATMALFQWVEWTGMQHLLGGYSRYILGFAGFAVMILGATLILDAWAFRSVLKGQYIVPPRLSFDHQLRERRPISILPTKIVDRKTVFLRSRLYSNMVRQLGEKLKCKLFVKMRFLKPRPEEVQVVSIEKYYEPYLTLAGKYAVDYYVKRDFTVKVDEDATEVAFLGSAFKPKPFSGHVPTALKVVQFEGEARFHHEDETYFVLDKSGREVAPEIIPVAPSEEQRVEELAEIGVKVGELEISREEEIDFLRSKIVNRPSDVVVTKEIFEVNERTVVYLPMYYLTFRNIKTRKMATLKIDGITGQISPEKPPDKRLDKNTTKPTEDSINEPMEHIPRVPMEKINSEPVLPKPSPAKATMRFPMNVVGEAFYAGDGVTAVVGDAEIPPGTTVFETLVVKGNLRIGPGCRISGKVKALRDIMIGANTTIDGNVISGGKVIIGPNTVIHGSLESDGIVEIAENVVVEGGLYSKSSVVLNQTGGAFQIGKADESVSVVKGGKDD